MLPVIGRHLSTKLASVLVWQTNATEWMLKFSNCETETPGSNDT